MGIGAGCISGIGAIGTTSVTGGTTDAGDFGDASGCGGCGGCGGYAQNYSKTKDVTDLIRAAYLEMMLHNFDIHILFSSKMRRWSCWWIFRWRRRGLRGRGRFWRFWRFGRRIIVWRIGRRRGRRRGRWRRRWRMWWVRGLWRIARI